MFVKCLIPKSVHTMTKYLLLNKRPPSMGGASGMLYETTQLLKNTSATSMDVFFVVSTACIRLQ